MLFEAEDETPGTKRVITTGGLPELVGTEAEVRQAAEIRTRILVDADDVLTRLRSDEIITEAQTDTDIVSPRQVTTEQVRAAEAALNRLRSHSAAGWWIAHRDGVAGEILAALMIQGAP